MSIARRGGVESLILLSGGAGNPEMLAGTADPTAGAGIAASIGSMYFRYDAGGGQVWKKTGAGDTNWNQLPILDGTNTFLGAQGSLRVALTDADPIVTDASLSNSFLVQLTVLAGNTREIANPTNLVDGFNYQWRFKQPAAPGAVQALTFDTKWKFPDGSVPTLTASNDAVDIITAAYDATDDVLEVVPQTNFS